MVGKIFAYFYFIPDGLRQQLRNPTILQAPSCESIRWHNKDEDELKNLIISICSDEFTIGFIPRVGFVNPGFSQLSRVIMPVPGAYPK